jgi:hypothetical protein
MNLTDLFAEIKRTGAYVAEPVGDAEIEKCNSSLEECGYPRMPEDYAKFLKVANGFAWNGFEFYGTVQSKEKQAEGGFKLRDIVTFNDEYCFDEEILILGKFDEDYYVYDSQSGRYFTVDRLTLMESNDYKDIEDMILGDVGAYAFQ